MKKKLLTVTLAGAMAFGGSLIGSTSAGAVGNGPNYGGNESLQNSILTTHAEMVSFLKTQDAKQPDMELEKIGESVKGRDLFLVKYIKNPKNPTILFVTQQHGNEALNTEGALQFIKEMGSGKMKGILDGVNILIVPRLNPDGAAGDVNFSLDDYVGDGDYHLTRYNANHVDLNRDHVDRTQPETQALHNNVLGKYPIDYMIDLHHQGAQSERDGELVSGSILYPTNANVAPDVLQKSKQLGAVIFDTIESKGWGHLGKYIGGDAPTISRNGLALEYGISTVLFEVRGMADHYYEPYALGQKGNGYLIKQAEITMEATSKAISDGSILKKDVSFWDTLAEQNTRETE
ncbi:M14 family zinc carboxypeptidase [Neobacillus mesonae]|uniref:M14 family zinc carboxypeptidase n=1 Tax=Neobacillus mesonae TaxID=1193713 RepID=UPI00203E59C4|nr:M14 family zinc carboxypeptidase [Neobacillus mesonae]MCM3569008.1 carboxypeptidase [Neobacillus mesonae]